MAQNIIPSRPPGATGVYATEDLHSRVGMTSGLFGVQNATRLMHVHLAAPGDDPFNTIRNLSSANGGMREGDIFPWPEGNQVLVFFTIEECRTSRYYLLRANYVPTFVAAFMTDGAQLWDVEINTALETEHVLVDANNKGIGTPKYRVVSGNANTVWAATTRDDRDVETSLNTPSGLGPLDSALPRHLEGMDRDKAVGSVTATKKIQWWNIGAIAAATRFTNCLNAADSEFSIDSIYGRLLITKAEDAGMIKFQGVRIGKAQQGAFRAVTGGLVPIQLSPGGLNPVGCQVTMVFKFDADGFDEIRTHKHKFDHGAEAPVRWMANGLERTAQEDKVNNPDGTAPQPGDIIRERFIRYPKRTSFTSLMQMFR